MFSSNSNKKKILTLAAVSAVGSGVALLVAKRRAAKAKLKAGASKLKAAAGKARAAGRRVARKASGRAKRAS